MSIDCLVKLPKVNNDDHYYAKIRSCVGCSQSGACPYVGSRPPIDLATSITSDKLREVLSQALHSDDRPEDIRKISTYRTHIVQLRDACLYWINYIFKSKSSQTKAIVGLSGGLNSLVVCKLCVDALGVNRVIAVLLPDSTNSVSARELLLARKFTDTYGVKSYETDIHPVINANLLALQSSVGRVNRSSRVNLPARIRMSLLYAVSQSNDGLVANTTNLSESYLGYTTIYGDLAGDFSPLAKLTMTEVGFLGASLGLSSEFLPTSHYDGLCGRSDEDNLGVTYDVLDRYIRTGEIDDLSNKAWIDELHSTNKFKSKLMLSIPTFIPYDEQPYLVEYYTSGTYLIDYNLATYL